jgi:sarcosine oxidase
MDDPSFYGFPYLDEAGLKVGQDVGGREVTARSRTFEPDADALERARAFVERVIPGGAGEVRSIKTCLYTLTPDRDFVIDASRSEGGEGCFVAIGAGHAFKFASAIGRTLADLALRGAAREGVDLEPFRIDRPVLQEKDPKRSFLV